MTKIDALRISLTSEVDEEGKISYTFGLVKTKIKLGLYKNIVKEIKERDVLGGIDEDIMKTTYPPKD